MNPISLPRWPLSAGDDKRRTAIVLMLAFVACVLMLYGRHLGQPQGPIGFSITLATSTGGSGQVFIETPAGYAEAGSVSFPLSGDGRLHRYNTRIESTGIPDRIRFDPGAGVGDLQIQSIELRAGGAEWKLAGAELQSTLRPLNQLTIEQPLTEHIRLHSTGDDPYFEFSTPAGMQKARDHKRRLGMALVFAGIVVAVVLLLTSFDHVRRMVRRGFARGNAGLFVLIALIAVALMTVQGFGCGASICSTRGLGYGSALLLASLGFAVVGAAVTQATGLFSPRSATPRLFLHIVIGQVALVLYLFVRSALHAAIPQLPVTAAELFVVAGLSTVYLSRKSAFTTIVVRPGRGRAWLLLEFALLTAACIVVADRELPRVLMLSSDPDTHAYLARQVELLGAIPWRGESVFNYPAGSAALTVLWAKLSFLDVRNALTALPLLQTLLAGLMLGEAVAVRTRSLPARLLIQATALSVTVAGFLVPLFANYSHMEGAGRQVAIAFAAILPAMLMAAPYRANDRRLALFATPSLFVLAVLNPVNVVIPCILVGACIFYVALAQRRISWLVLAPPALFALLLLDPYYSAMVFGWKVPVEKITVTDAFQLKSTSEILADWIRHHQEQPFRFIAKFWTMMPAHRTPLFAVFLIPLLGLYLATTRRRPRWLLAVTVVAVFAALVAASGLFAALQDDRRFYLLSPYFGLSIAQHKILLVTSIAAAIVWLGGLRKWPPLVLLSIAGAITLMIHVGMRRDQVLVLQPRANYCGSLGCITDSDVELLRRFEALMRRGRGTGREDAVARVLVPNSVHDTGNEFWIFPVAGARALPFFDGPPVAFYYYQGDDDFTTENYMEHVCKRFDRDWLKAEDVTHVFLPANRNAACIHSMESLPASEEIVLNVGNSYLLRLR